MAEGELPDLGHLFAPTPTQLQGITPYPAAVKKALEAPQELPDLEEMFGKPEFTYELRLRTEQSMHRIMDAIGLGARQGFGDAPIATPMTSLSPESEKALQDYGIINDYKKGQNSFLRTFNEGLVRDTASLIQLGGRALGAVTLGVAGGAEQAAKEMGIEGLDLPGLVTDPTSAFALGPVGEYAALSNAARLDNLRRETLMARANGAVSEGEAGFYDAHPLTPENAQARVDAAHEAGIEPPLPQPVPRDVHELARRIDPPTFEKFDALEAAKNAHRQTLADLAAAQENQPEVVQTQQRINDALDKLQKAGWNLSQSAAERITENQERLNSLLKDETPAMKKTRKAMEDAAIAQRNLQPDLDAAYRQARDMMPDTEAETVKAVRAASEGKPPEAPPPQEAVAEAAPGAAPTAATRPRTTTNIRPVEGTGPAITRTLSEGVEAKAIEEKLTESFGDLPEYHEVSMADQAAKAAEYLAKSAEDAKAVAMGQKASPRGVLPESIFVAVEKDAIAKGDVETLRQLATESKLTTAATTMGQRIRTLGERDKTSPVAAIADVQAARQAALEARNATALKDAAKEIKATVRRAATKRDAWRSFIEAITCPE